MTSQRFFWGENLGPEPFVFSLGEIEVPNVYKRFPNSDLVIHYILVKISYNVYIQLGLS